MRDVLHLARRYLAHHRGTSAVLVAAIALVLYLPAGLRALVRASEAQLRARAEATPLVVGAKGSPLELVLRALYFAGGEPAPLRQAEAERIRASGLAAAIPLHVRFHAQGAPVVGTSLDYFEVRGLRVARGRMLTRLGDCVLGAHVAARRGLAPGARVTTSPERAFEPGGLFPLRLRVTGVLAPAGTPDDDAVFVELATAWTIEGLAHGHEAPGAAELLAEAEGHAVANEAVRRHLEVTDENRASFHFHGDVADYPLSAVLALPRDERAAAILMGRYEGPGEQHQILRPSAVAAELLGAVLRVEGFVTLALALAAAATLALATLVLTLSLELRRKELETLARIGASRGRIAALVGCEVAAILSAGALLALGLTWLTAELGPELVRRAL